MEKYELHIDNSSKADRVLLFRIRRSADQKLLTFSPKKGFVLCNEKKAITILILNEKFARAKLLVKLVAVPRDQIVQDFDASWAKGVEVCGGEVKKVIEILNPYFSGPSPGMHDTMSEVSGGSWFASNMSVDGNDLDSASAFEITTDSHTLMSEQIAFPSARLSDAIAAQAPQSRVSAQSSAMSIQQSANSSFSLQDLAAQLMQFVERSNINANGEASSVKPSREDDIELRRMQQQQQQQQVLLKVASALLQSIHHSPTDQILENAASNLSLIHI